MAIAATLRFPQAGQRQCARCRPAVPDRFDHQDLHCNLARRACRESGAAQPPKRQGIPINMRGVFESTVRACSLTPMIMSTLQPATGSSLQLYVPKLVTLLRRGYHFDDFRHDLVAGLTVAVVALPLAMALAIASGTTPEKGLYTAIVAGFLISLLGGSRVQVGGPTAAFIPVVFNVIDKHGFGGLILCTLLAGCMLIAAGVLRLGVLLKYIPKPVVTGFTAGIAVSIFSSQVKDLLGLDMVKVPAEFFARWSAYARHLPGFSTSTVAVSAVCVATIVLLRKVRPNWPGFLIVVVGGAVVVTLIGLPVDTIGTRFGGIPDALPTFAIPHIPFERTRELLPVSLTIAFLAGV